MCCHQGFVDENDPHRSDDIKQPCTHIECSFLVGLARGRHCWMSHYQIDFFVSQQPSTLTPIAARWKIIQAQKLLLIVPTDLPVTIRVSE